MKAILMWDENYDAEWMSLYNADTDRIADALFLALSYRDFKAAADLIPLQEDINSRDDQGDWTFLMEAVYEDVFSIVKLLVEAGADVNLRGMFEPEEDFALNLAAFGHNKEIYDYLAPLTSAIATSDRKN
ncbi:MAG: ankyrin repeat domain-containing protein [Microcoleaceae cyanobacterium]